MERWFPLRAENDKLETETASADETRKRQHDGSHSTKPTTDAGPNPSGECTRTGCAPAQWKTSFMDWHLRQTVADSAPKL